MCRLRALALLLCLTAVFSMQAGAALPADHADARRADLEALDSILRNHHPDLFANITEQEYEQRKAEIETRLGTDSDFVFALDLSSLAALVKDSHTQVSIGSAAEGIHCYPFNLSRFDGRWILSSVDSGHKELLGMEVTAINGLGMDEVVRRFAGFVSADNVVKLRRQYRQLCNVSEVCEYAGIVQEGQPLKLTLRAGDGAAQTLSVQAAARDALGEIASLQDRRTAQPDTACDKSRYYFSRALSTKAYYIQYNCCAEDPNLPMQTFCEQVRGDLDAGSYSVILLDLRYNGGGSDGVLWPLLTMLRQEIAGRSVRAAALIGEQTFSSAVINAVELREAGFVLAGEPTSGSVDHFGSVNSFELPNSGIRVGVSSKYIALSGMFDAAAGMGVQSLTPDVELPQTLADYLAGRDTCVDAILADPGCLKADERPDAPLTRGRFIGQLYEAVGGAAQEVVSPFEDLFGIEWYLPALNWASAERIARGTGSGAFAAARTLSWQEAAAFLVRTAGAIGLQPQKVRDSGVPDALLCGAWDAASLKSAWEWGLLPQDADFSSAPTRAQGIAMAQALAAIR